jgi:hypothetical protein
MTITEVGRKSTMKNNNNKQDMLSRRVPAKITEVKKGKSCREIKDKHTWNSETIQSLEQDGIGQKFTSRFV